MGRIKSLQELRSMYEEPSARALKKELDHLDEHCRRFIALSPFLVMATSAESGELDTSPRGGTPGFVKVTPEGLLLIPDWPGNNRLDSFSNLVETGEVSLIFLIPGITETLRVNGTAELRTDESYLELCTERDKLPKLAITVQVRQAFVHCAKAVIRSHLWSADHQIDRGQLPSMSSMLKSHTGIDAPEESQEEMLARYEQSLY